MKDLLGKTLGNYRLERILGRGRMGVVYLAQDVVLLRPTAIKILSWVDQSSGQDPMKWFLSEARSVARINHPGVVQIYHVAKQDNVCYIAMEYVEGETVEISIEKEGPFSFGRASDVLCQVASALHAAHRCGIIHRDIKPANLLSSVNGRVKLSDFGMALSYSSSMAVAAALRVGTPCFMAPELWEGSQATPASDIYSLGATYYYMLTGRLAFEARNVDDLRQMHLCNSVPDPRSVIPTIPTECNEIIQRCMAKRPFDRFESAQELDWMLRGVLQHQGNQSNAPPIKASNTLRKFIQGMLPRPAKGVLADAMGFAYEPFGHVDPRHIPYLGEPFASLAHQLSQAFSQAGTIILVKGLRGSGKTVLCCQEATKLNPCQPVIYLDTRVERTQNLLRMIRRAISGSPDEASDAEAELEGIVEKLRSIGSSPERPVVLILDSMTLDNDAIHAELKALLRLVQISKTIVIALIGSPSLDRELQKFGLLPEKVQINQVAIPALEPLQTKAYINSWIEYAVDPTAPMIFVTPDACLQVAHGASGNIGWINRISANMLHLAAFQKRRVITSWEAWIASSDREMHLAAIGDVRPETFSQREYWPTKEGLIVINNCRREARIPARGEIYIEDLLKRIGKGYSG